MEDIFEWIRQFVLSKENITEVPHFDKVAFKSKSKILMTMNVKENRICVRLSLENQNIFCSYNKNVIYAVPNKWGKHGWTLVNLADIQLELLEDVINCSYEDIHKKN